MTTVSPSSEVRRQRAENQELRRLMAAHLAADPGPVVSLSTALSWAREHYDRGHAAGADSEHLALAAAEKRVQHGIVAALRAAAPPAARWHVCCLSCRRTGHRGGCRDCQDRDRATFAEPIDGDYRVSPVQWQPSSDTLRRPA